MVEDLSGLPDLIPVYQSDKFTLSREGVMQGDFVATALSATKIISNYESLSQTFLSPKIFFKFGLNGNDNEMEYGRNHFIHCITTDATCETPLLKFGEQFIDHRPLPDNIYLKPNTTFKIRLDLRDVLEAFATAGYYQSFCGEKIFASDFKGVFVAGSAAPLTWDFPNLAANPELQLKDETGEGIYEISLVINPLPGNTDHAGAEWTLTKDTSGFPQHKSDFPLLDALYNLALEEMVQAVEPDNTFRTGKEWAGVWTRDVSYSIILALAAVQPGISQHSLMQKVKNGRIVQDTGTGGAYPVSTDRQVWAVAAWEVYLVTGNSSWLRQAYQIIHNSLEDDYQHIYDKQTGLVRGESSFLDWREQTYPAWMQPADIFESECLGTNAVHYQANKVLAQMADQLGDKAAHTKYDQIAEKIKSGINTYLWQPQQGYYGQYLYGRNYKILSPRAEALGEALCVLFDIADPAQQKEIIEKTPVVEFGIPCIYPQIPEIPPYHNQAVWPFVQAFWSLAAARVGHETALTGSISAFYRSTALFLTHKENFVSTTGDFGGTQINSDNMLWSLAGNLGIVYKIFFGLQFTADGLVFKPFVPEAFAGNYRLINFKYRQAVLSIYLEGFGNIIENITLNDQVLESGTLPQHLSGNQEVKIKLAGNKLPAGKINKAKDKVSPDTPQVTAAHGKISWLPVEHAVAYRVIKNGGQLFTTTETSIDFSDRGYAEYQVIAVATDGFESFASEPLVVSAPTTLVYKIGRVNAQGYVEISKNINRVLQVPAFIPEPGAYAIDVRYANGNGPVETDNKCAFRALQQEGTLLGTLVMPQRGLQAWSDWGYSNAVIANFEKGNIRLTLAYLPSTENMNGEINEARLDHIRFIRLD